MRLQEPKLSHRARELKAKKEAETYRPNAVIKRYATRMKASRRGE